MTSSQLPSDAATEATLAGPLLDHLLASAGKTRHVGPKRFGIAGDGPFAEAEVTRALVARDREVYFADASVGAIVVGRNGWQSGLRQSIEAHRGQELRVYTHEMLLTLLLTRTDPYTLGEERVRALFGDHPALRFLEEQARFAWPTLFVPELSEPPPEAGEMPRYAFHDTGILSAFDCRAGKDAPGARARQHALRRAYEHDLPARAKEALRQRIATARTPARLRQLAYAIAHQFNLASRRRDADMRRALAHWRADLAWLKTTFYDRLDPPDFGWPDLPGR